MSQEVFEKWIAVFKPLPMLLKPVSFLAIHSDKNPRTAASDGSGDSSCGKCPVPGSLANRALGMASR